MTRRGNKMYIEPPVFPIPARGRGCTLDLYLIHASTAAYMEAVNKALADAFGGPSYDTGRGAPQTPPAPNRTPRMWGFRSNQYAPVRRVPSPHAPDLPEVPRHGVLPTAMRAGPHDGPASGTSKLDQVLHALSGLPAALPMPPALAHTSKHPLRSDRPRPSPRAHKRSCQERLQDVIAPFRPDLSSDDDSDLSADDISAVRQVVYEGIPDGTAKTEISAWKSWCAAATKLGLNPWRGLKNSPKEHLKVGRIVLTVYENMKPRRKSDPAPKPASAFAVYLAVARLLKREGYCFPKVSLVKSIIKGLVASYIRKFGFRTLVPKRAEPFTVAQAKALRALPMGSKIGNWRLQEHSLATASWRALNSTLFNTGMRSDEVCTSTVSKGLSKRMLTRASLVYRIAGENHADPSTNQLRSMTAGDGLHINVRPSKTDSDGSFWCDKPIWLPFGQSDSNACGDFVRMELDHPCHGLLRTTIALFANDDGSPFTKNQMVRALDDALALVGLAARKDEYSWHSFRVTLACLLDAAKCPPATIKRMCRWISDESLHTYIRPNDRNVAFWLDKILSCEVRSSQARNLPHVEELLRAQQRSRFLADMELMATYDVPIIHD